MSRVIAIHAAFRAQLAERIARSDHKRDIWRSKLNAHQHSPAATAVRSINTGSVARCPPSAKTRQPCARVISPKVVPVVIRYAFIGIVLLCPESRNRPRFAQMFPHNQWNGERRLCQPVRSSPLVSITGRGRSLKPFVTRPVWAMIQFMLLTGCRPSEWCRLNWSEMDTSHAGPTPREPGDRTAGPRIQQQTGDGAPLCLPGSVTSRSERLAVWVIPGRDRNNNQMNSRRC